MKKNLKRMPVLFVGHGSPMLALDHNDITASLKAVGEKIIAACGWPEAILMISAHWYKNRNLVQKTDRPEQIYDMYGFPQALYEVKYEPAGCAALSDAVLALDGVGAEVDNSWGIDHGAWTPLVHIFPDASIPVVQFSVNGAIPPERVYEIGKAMAQLRERRFMIIGSGNIVHNLRMVNWDSDHGSPEAEAFNDFIVGAIEDRNDSAIINYSENPFARYAVNTADHFLPLLYVLGASQGEEPLVFNKRCVLDSMAMTSFLFGQGA